MNIKRDRWLLDQAIMAGCRSAADLAKYIAAVRIVRHGKAEE